VQAAKAGNKCQNTSSWRQSQVTNTRERTLEHQQMKKRTWKQTLADKQKQKHCFGTGFCGSVAAGSAAKEDVVR